MGRQYTRLEHTGGPAVARRAPARTTGEDDDLIEEYSLREPPFAVQREQGTDEDDCFVLDAEDGVWRRARDHARGEAVLLCGGSLTYDRTLERNAHAGGAYEFRTHFRHLRPLLDQADLAVGSLSTMVADGFPTKIGRASCRERV